MTEMLTVPTHFGDLSELSSGLADRVDEERIILYGPVSYDEGSYVSFEVLLLDGTPALEGIGRVAAAVDGGEARAPETRFDIVFDTLQLEGRSEVVYERIVLARQSMMGEGDPATGEVDVSELEAAHAEEIPVDTGDEPAEAYADDDAYADGYEDEEPAEAAADDPMDMEEDLEDLVSFSDSELPPAPEGGVDAEAYAEAAEQQALDDYADADDEIVPEQPTVVAAIEDIEPTAERPSGAPPPSLPDAPQGFELPPPPQGLTRPVFAASWWPTADPRPEPRMSSGYFDHRGGLPIPGAPPRPDLDPTLRVSPAPRPGAEAVPAAPAPRAEPEPLEDDEYDAGATMEAPLDYDEPVDVPAEVPAGEDIMFDELDDVDPTAHEMPLPEE